MMRLVFIAATLFMGLNFTACVHSVRPLSGDSAPSTASVTPPDAGLNQKQPPTELAAEIFQRMPLIEDAKTRLYANMVGQYLAKELLPSLSCQARRKVSATGVRVAIVRSKMPLSFSLSGGLVFVTTALMQQMSTEDEFAGVVANEMVMSACEKGAPSESSKFEIPPLDRASLAFADRSALVALYRRGYDLTPYVDFISKNETAGRRRWGPERVRVLQKMIAATPRFESTFRSRTARFLSAKANSI